MDNGLTKTNEEKIKQAKEMFKEENNASSKESGGKNLKWRTATILNSILIIANLFFIVDVIPLKYSDSSNFNSALELIAFLLGWPLIIIFILSFIFSIKSLKRGSIKSETEMQEIKKQHTIVLTTFILGLLSVILFLVLAFAK